MERIRSRLLAGVFKNERGVVERFHVVFWSVSEDEWRRVRSELEALITEIDLYLMGKGKRQFVEFEDDGSVR